MDTTLLAIFSTFLPINRRGVIARSLLNGATGMPAQSPMVDEAAVERVQKNCERLGIEIVTITSTQYPDTLKSISDPPPALYVRGEASILSDSNMLAVVGARKADMENCETAADFAQAAALCNFRVVSGLALGIDGAAHTGALRSNRGGSTLAVVGNGVDRTYPEAHARLAGQIIREGGAIISEYPPGTSPRPYHFLERNRIVAGLSKGVIVIQAGDRSGALVTARLAIESGREVWVVPGAIRDDRFRGSNRLIQMGAHLVTSPFDITGITAGNNRNETTEAQLTTEEAEIHALIPPPDAIPFDQLVAQSNRTPASLRVILNTLEEKGHITTVPGNSVRRSN